MDAQDANLPSTTRQRTIEDVKSSSLTSNFNALFLHTLTNTLSLIFVGLVLMFGAQVFTVLPVCGVSRN